MTPHKLREYVSAGMASADSGIVQDCKILGTLSLNSDARYGTTGRHYLKEAITQAIPLYEGAPVYIDHAKRPGTDETRPFIEKFGWFEHVRVAGDGSLRGDFRYNPAHPLAATFEGWVKGNPTQIGFSHNADGRVREDGRGGLLVEEIVSVESVDLVSRPASTQGLFEAMGALPERKDPDDEECPPGSGQPCDPDEQGSMLADLKDSDEEEMTASTPGAGDNYATCLGELLMAIVTDPNMAPKDKRKKALVALNLIDDDCEVDGDMEPGEEKLDENGEPLEEEDEDGDEDDKEDGKSKNPFGSSDEPDDDDTEDPDEKKKMSKKDKYQEAKEALQKSKDPNVLVLLERLDCSDVADKLREADANARKLCEGRLPEKAITDIFVRKLCEARTDEERLAMIEDRKSVLQITKKPVSLPPGGGKPGAITMEELIGGL